MANCLVKEYLGTVNDPSMKRYGVYTLYGMLNSDTTTKHWLQITSDANNSVVATISGATFGDVQGGSTTKIDDTHVKITGPTSDNAAVEVVGDANAIFSIEFDSKYHLTKLNCTYERFLGFVGFDDELKFSPLTEGLYVFSKSADFTNFLKNKFGSISINGISELSTKNLVTSFVANNVVANGRNYDLYTFDIENLSTLTALQSLDLQYAGNKVKGNVSALASLTSIIGLNIAGTAINGDIANLGSMTSLSSANFYNCDITGTVESFVQAQRAAGRTTNSTGITLASGFGNFVTIDGHVPSEQSPGTKLYWTADIIIYGTITVNA